MDESGPPQALELGAAEAELLTDELGEVGHPLSVTPGVEVLCFQRLDEALDGGFVGLTKLGVGDDRQMAQEVDNEDDGDDGVAHDQHYRSQQSAEYASGK